MRNLWLFLAGLVFLALAKMKHVLRGYATPKSFDSSEKERSFDYDVQVVDKWLAVLRAQQPAGIASITSRRVLELGPGADLGVGMVLRASGAAQYTAFDVNALDGKVADEFYVYFAQRLQQRIPGIDTAALLEEVRKARVGQGSSLRYLVRGDFDLTGALAPGDIDVVFSNAAFEHFDDVGRTARHLFQVCAHGAVVVIGIDLQTHSRWIRDEDPNNIYRYPDWLYRLFHFRGIPNRLRSTEYVEHFRRAGWQDVTVLRDNEIPALDKRADVSGMSGRFSRDADEMRILSLTLIARKP